VLSGGSLFLKFMKVISFTTCLFYKLELSLDIPNLFALQLPVMLSWKTRSLILVSLPQTPPRSVCNIEAAFE
jgi:hypothetical protein